MSTHCANSNNTQPAYENMSDTVILVFQPVTINIVDRLRPKLNAYAYVYGIQGIKTGVDDLV